MIATGAASASTASDVLRDAIRSALTIADDEHHFLVAALLAEALDRAMMVPAPIDW